MMLSLVLTIKKKEKKRKKKEKKTRKAATRFVGSSIAIQNGYLQNTKLRTVLPEERRGSLVGVFAKASTFSLSPVVASTGDARITLFRSRKLLHQPSS
jgi:hypothetical protein